MRARRLGLILATVIVLANLAYAADINPDPETGVIGPLPVIAAVVAAMLAAITLVLIVPAWLGRQAPARVIATVQLVGILQAAPVFFLPVRVIPAGAVVLAALGALVSMLAVTLILIESSRVLLGSAAVVVTVALYAGLVAAVSALLPVSAERSVQTASAIVVALLFEPILTLMRRTVARSLYGGRLDPARTALRLNDLRSGSGSAIDAAVEETRRVLRLPRLNLTEHGRSIASAGEAAPEAVVAALPLDPELGLELRVTLRRGEARLHRDDRAALELVAAPLALLVRESALIGELRAARAEAALARESERATIHRELHDGLGPLLTGAAFRIDAARAQIATRPSAGEDTTGAVQNLGIVRADLRTAIEEVRRVVYGLRPAELEQRSVWSAVSRLAAAVDAVVRLPEPEPELSAAVELAVYRIVAEAITNIERHAPGSVVRLDLVVDGGALHVHIANEGPVGRRATEGIGSRSMRDRAEELGGEFSAGPTAEGWLVRVELPLA